VGLAACTAVAHQAGAFEDDEMLGDGGRGDAGAAGQGMDGQLAIAGEALEEGAAGGVGERFEEMVRDGWHERNNNHLVMDCQAGILGFRKFFGLAAKELMGTGTVGFAIAVAEA
jgi:hypothetical protein